LGVALYSYLCVSHSTRTFHDGNTLIDASRLRILPCSRVCKQQGSFNFIIDTYLQESATALSANTIVRSLFGAGFPVNLFLRSGQLYSNRPNLQLFASQLYDKLGPRWASTLLGCIALVMIPIPVLFMRYGHILRARSRYTPHV
jgi:hypothetical protein